MARTRCVAVTGMMEDGTGRTLLAGKTGDGGETLAECDVRSEMWCHLEDLVGAKLSSDALRSWREADPSLTNVR